MRRRDKVLLLAALGITILACQSLSAPQPALSGMDVYLEARNKALQIKPLDLQLKLDPNSTTPYGVVIDDAFESEATMTLAAYASGDASMLFTSGGGRSDGIKFSNVQAAAKKLVSTATPFLDRVKPGSNYPLPTLDHVRFYILTPQGIYASDELSKNQLEAKGNPFWRLLYAEQDVVSAFRESSEP